MSPESDEPVASALSPRTTPTWEMELLISGATIFGLLQLPELIDHAYFRAVNLSPQTYASLMMPLWLYAKIGIVTLVLTFIAHLCLRGYWIALVGLDSVYPGGIRWDRLGLGPIARERFASRAPPMPELIERADNRATRVFGVGFSFAMLMLALVLLVSLALLAGLVADLLFGQGAVLRTLGAVIGLVLGPWMLVTLLDRRFGHRLARWPALRSMIGSVAAAYGRLGLGPRSNPLMALFASHAGRLRFAALSLLVILPVATVIIAQASMARGQLPFGLDPGVSGADPFSPSASPAAFYADLRGEPFAVMPLPYIPSRLSEGDYLPLFVPFIPRLHGAALPLACPEALAGSGRGEDARPRLDCLARMLAIEVDGAPVATPLEATTDPDNGQPGLLAMLPVATLAPGRHEITLNEPDRRTLDRAPPRRYRIAFWR
jgi:hypothetical protein